MDRMYWTLNLHHKKNLGQNSLDIFWLTEEKAWWLEKPQNQAASSLISLCHWLTIENGHFDSISQLLQGVIFFKVTLKKKRFWTDQIWKLQACNFQHAKTKSELSNSSIHFLMAWFCHHVYIFKENNWQVRWCLLLLCTVLQCSGAKHINHPPRCPFCVPGRAWPWLHSSEQIWILWHFRKCLQLNLSPTVLSVKSQKSFGIIRVRLSGENNQMAHTG